MAPRLQVTDPAESIRKKRAPVDRQRGTGAEDRPRVGGVRAWGGRGRYHTVSTVFYLEKEYRAAGASINSKRVSPC